MKKSVLLLVVSFLSIILLYACNSSPTSSVVSTAHSVSGQSTSAFVSSQSSTSSLSSQWNSVTSQSSTSDSGSVSSDAQQLFVSISRTSIQNATSINVHTLPGAAITIELSYCGQSSKQIHYADTAGEYLLNWTPNSRCGGMATATVTASSNGQSSTSSTSFSIS